MFCDQISFHLSFQVVTAADVCLLGLNIIMPLMSAELLKFPNLCLQVSNSFLLNQIETWFSF